MLYTNFVCQCPCIFPISHCRLVFSVIHCHLCDACMQAPPKECMHTSPNMLCQCSSSDSHCRLGFLDDPLSLTVMHARRPLLRSACTQTPSSAPALRRLSSASAHCWLLQQQAMQPCKLRASPCTSCRFLKPSGRALLGEAGMTRACRSSVRHCN